MEDITRLRVKQRSGEEDGKKMRRSIIKLRHSIKCYSGRKKKSIAKAAKKIIGANLIAPHKTSFNGIQITFAHEPQIGKNKENCDFEQ